MYADRLSEEGDPRGELIALACAVQELDEYDRTYSALLARMHHLERSERARLSAYWGMRVPVYASAGHLTPVMYRGLPFGLIGPAAEVVARLGQLPLAMVQMTSVGRGDLEALARSPALAKIVDLSLTLVEGEDLAYALASLFASPHLGALRQLSLTKVRAGDAAALARCAALSELRYLSLGGPVTDRDARDLAAAPHLRSVTSLRFDKSELTVAGIEAVMGGGWSLESLVASDHPLGPDGACAIANHPRAARLRALDLWAAGIGMAGAIALVGAPALAGLRRLSLAGHYADDGRQGDLGTGWAAVFGALALPELRSLDLSRTPMGDDGARHLAGCDLEKLVELRLEGCAITDRGMVWLAGTPFEALRLIDVSKNELTGRGIALLAGAPWLARIEDLDLMRNPIEAGGYARLGSAPLGELRWLWIDCAHDDDLHSVLANPSIVELEMVFTFDADPLRVWLGIEGLRLRDLDCMRYRARREDLLALARTPRAQSIEQMTIESNDFDDEVAEAFVVSPYLAGLHELVVESSGLTDAGRARLEAYFGYRFLRKHERS